MAGFIVRVIEGLDISIYLREGKGEDVEYSFT